MRPSHDEESVSRGVLYYFIFLLKKIWKGLTGRNLECHCISQSKFALEVRGLEHGECHATTEGSTHCGSRENTSESSAEEAKKNLDASPGTPKP